MHSNVRAELARRNFKDFIKEISPAYEIQFFHDYIISRLEAFEKGHIKKLMVLIPPQHGKLLPANTPVFTTAGWKEHGTLLPGDYVFGHDGKPKKVIANSGLYNWNVQKINIQGGISMLAAKEHEWVLECDHDDHKGRVRKIYETQNIFKRRNRRNPAINIAPALEMPEVNLPINPYILGCWLGDGDRVTSKITVGEEDVNHFSQLGIAKKVKERIYSIRVADLQKTLRVNGILGAKKIPAIYFLSSIQQRFELLRGLMDTDGCVDFRGRCEFTQKDNGLADQVYTLLRTLGIKPTINTYKAMLNGVFVGYKKRVLFTPEKGQKIFNLKRKQIKLENSSVGVRGDKLRYFIESVEPYGETLGNCIEVEGGTYLAGENFIPTHNSTLTSRLFPAYIIGKDPKRKIVIVSYAATVAHEFARDAKNFITSGEYQEIFPKVKIGKVLDEPGSYGDASYYYQTNPYQGYIYAVGRGGSLTSKTVDIGIVDDPFKDKEDAMSLNTREKLWSWYINVFRTRLHNNSQEILIQTRWDKDDLAGRILKEESDWEIIKFPAIRTSHYSEYDPRLLGEALWPEKHSLEKTLDQKAKSEATFNALYQQDPQPNSNVLIHPDFIAVESFPLQSIERWIIGLDYGYTRDETAVVAIGVWGNKRYWRTLIYQTAVPAEDIKAVLIKTGFDRCAMYSEHDPDMITQLRRLGLAVNMANKSVYAGIMAVNSHENYYLSTDKYLHNEIINYQYKTIGDIILNDPQDGNDHICNAGRYTIFTDDYSRK